MIKERVLEVMTEWVENNKYTSHTAFAEYLINNPDFEYNSKLETLRRSVSDIYRENFSDKEIVTENVRLAKQKQKFQDVNRIERKSFREHVRLDNALEMFNAKLINALEKLSPPTIEHESLSNSAVGVLHSSDLHFNELVESGHNRYDFHIASKRLKKHVTEAISYFKLKGIVNVLFANTGDNLNSDRRLDELLNMSTNRGNATALGAYLIEQAILELNKHFNVTVAYVTGNESRVKQEYGYSKLLASDNYDATLFNMLKVMFRDCEGVEFVSGDPSEMVINVAGYNWLLLHGDAIPASNDVEKKVQQIKGKYSARGIEIRYVIFGHVHSARIGDMYARSSSTVGDNDYSDKALQLSGRASQNIYIAYSDGSIDGIKVDLQNVEDVRGYDIIDELIAYNAKSVQKLHKPQTIFQVVV